MRSKEEELRKKEEELRYKDSQIYNIQSLPNQVRGTAVRAKQIPRVGGWSRPCPRLSHVLLFVGVW